MIVLGVITISAVTAYITTKIITTKYFDVIDGHVKGLLEDTRKEISDVIHSNKPNCPLQAIRASFLDALHQQEQ